MKIVDGIVNLFRFDKTNWRAVALCLVAATVFWFFNALNKEHTATISFPIDFQYNQSSFVPVRALPENVRINITGTGWDLLRKSVGFKVQPLLILLERPIETKKLPPSSVLALATAQYDNLKINHIASDTLILALDRKESKRVKLFIDTSKIKFKENFGRSSAITISPDSILLEGPSGELNQIPDSVQVQIPVELIDENFNVEGNVVLPARDGIAKSVETANVKFNVSPLTYQSKKVKVVVFPAPPFRHQLSTDSVRVSFRIPAAISSALAQDGGLFAVVDLREFETGTTQIVPSIKGSVPFAEVVKVDSITLRKY